jgi:hypothetical protein
MHARGWCRIRAGLAWGPAHACVPVVTPSMRFCISRRGPHSVLEHVNLAAGVILAESGLPVLGFGGRQFIESLVNLLLQLLNAREVCLASKLLFQGHEGRQGVVRGPPGVRQGACMHPGGGDGEVSCACMRCCMGRLPLTKRCLLAWWGCHMKLGCPQHGCVMQQLQRMRVSLHAPGARASSIAPAREHERIGPHLDALVLHMVHEDLYSPAEGRGVALPAGSMDGASAGPRLRCERTGGAHHWLLTTARSTRERASPTGGRMLICNGSGASLPPAESEFFPHAEPACR